MRHEMEYKRNKSKVKSSKKSEMTARVNDVPRYPQFAASRMISGNNQGYDSVFTALVHLYVATT